MNEQYIHGDLLEDSPRFVPCALFEKFGSQRVFYKSKKPEGVKETRQQKALAEVAEKKWQYYLDNYRPLEDTYMKQVDEMDSDGAYDFAKGTAGSATTAAFGTAKKNMDENIYSRGINPNSGVYQDGLSSVTNASGVSSADSKSRALTSQRDNFVGGLQNITAIGRDQSTTTQAGLSDLATSASSKAAQDAFDSYNNRAASINAAGSLFGAGAELYTGSKKK